MEEDDDSGGSGPKLNIKLPSLQSGLKLNQVGELLGG